jgi:hypothetical protein
MKQRLLCLAVLVAALVPVVGVAAATPANAYEVVSVCVTVTPKFIGAEVNGHPIGAGTAGQPRTCVGV